MRIRKLIPLLFILTSSICLSQSISLVDNQTANSLANYLVGPGITVSNASLSCNPQANGIFVNVNPFPNQTLTIDSGIVLTTGRVLSTTNDTGINRDRFKYADNVWGTVHSDPQIISLVGALAQRDLCFLKFDFIPTGDSAFMFYSYGSEEYPAYNCTQWSDAFGIFVSGPSSTYTNYAKVPGTNINVNANSINDGTNLNAFCTSLGAGSPFTSLYINNIIPNHISYNGMTKVLKARIPVVPYQTHTMKVAVSDIVDGKYDSGVFLKKGSLTSPTLLEIVSKKSTNGSTTNPLYLIEGCNSGEVLFNRINSSSALTVNVLYSGSASSADHNGVSNFVIPAGQAQYTYSIGALLDGLNEPIETLKIAFNCPAMNFVDSANYIIKDFARTVNMYNSANDTSICNNQSANLYYTKTDTMFTTFWTPSTNMSCTYCTNPIYTANNGGQFTTENVFLRITAAGCPFVDSPVTINIQPKPTVSLFAPAKMCLGDSLFMTPFVSPTGTYTFSWKANPTLSSTTIENPIAKPTSPQTYKVYVSTSIGCKDSASVNVGISNIRAEIDSIKIQVSSCGASNGSISMYTKTTTPNTPPYSYSINGGTSYTSTNLFNNLPAGSYNVSIKNGANCKFDTLINITSGSSAPTAIYTINNTSCGLNNGNAKITSKTGTGPFTYQWKQFATVISTDTFANNLAPGNYTLILTDALGCFSQYSIPIQSSTGINFSFFNTPQTCGLNNGALIASPTIGVAPYTYNWSNGVTSTNLISNLVGGKYKLTMTDSRGCTKIDSITLASFPAITITKSSTPANCGLMSGSASVNILTATPNYSYSWSNGLNVTTNNTLSTISNLSSGKYYITIVDAKACTKVDSVIVGSSPNVGFAIVKSDAKCGLNNGSCTINVYSGTPVYSYLWSDGNTNATRTNLAPNTYQLTVTDANGCTSTQTMFINSSSNPTLSLSPTHATCGYNNGTIVPSISNALAPISYSWSNSNTKGYLDSLYAGTYSLTITDSIGCIRSASVNITTTPGVNYTATVVQPSCGFNNGSITISGVVGSAPYSYNWADGSTSLTRTNLAPGTYEIIIVDVNGCSKLQQIILDPSSSPSISFNINHAICGLTTGSISAVVSNGIPAYSYLWSTGETSSSIVNKPTGIMFNLTVTDQKGCTGTLKDSLKYMPKPTYTDTVHKATCNGSNGYVWLKNVKGTNPITYQWSHDPLEVGTFVGGLWSGLFFVTITDGNNCQINDTFDTRTNGMFGYTYVIVKPSCNDSNGKITLTMNGGTKPFKINWSNKDTGLIADTLKHARYGVTIIDSLGCRVDDSITVKNQTILTDSFRITKTRCDTPTGLILTYPYNGTPPYKFTWKRKAKDTFSTLDSVFFGTYQLRITDSLGCKLDTTAFVDYDHYPKLKDSTTIEHCDSANAKIFIKIDSVINPIKIFWNGINDSVYNKNNFFAPQTISIRVVDSQKCQANVNVPINEIQPLYPLYAVKDPPCGNNKGSVNISNVNAPVTYSWNTGSTSSTINNLSPGIYNCTIIDFDNCHFYFKDTLSYTSRPVISFSNILRPNCGRSDGQLLATITSSYSIDSFKWFVGPTKTQVGSNSLLFQNVPPGKYYFTAWDVNGCAGTDSFDLKDSAAPKIIFTITHSNCVNGIGKIKAKNLGGSSPFTYKWYNFTTADSITNLFDGSYRLTLTDSRNCVRVDTAKVLYNQKPDISLLGTQSNCGNGKGAISTTITFGKSPFVYAWNSGQNTKNLNLINAGFYKLTVTDSLGCKDSDTITITKQDPLKVSYVKNPAFCDLNNGTIVATIDSGTPPFVFNWNGTSSSLAISGLDSGKHIFNITDNNNCVLNDTVKVDRVSKPAITHSVIDDNCTYQTGKITSSVIGGKTPLTYAWSNGVVNSLVANNLYSGTYTLSVTDSLGCIVTKSAVIGDTAGPIVSLTKVDASCGFNNGSITANVTSPRSPFSHFWNNVSGSNSISNLNGGKFYSKVIDNRGCIKIDSSFMDTIQFLAKTKTVKQATCNLSNGNIKVNITGGSIPYTYLWSHTAISADSVSNLSSGTYYLTVVDSKGCSFIDTSVLIQNGLPIVSFTTTVATCKLNNGSITTNLSNAFDTYTYAWSNGANTQNLVNVTPGFYLLTITNAAGCNINASTTLNSIGVDSINMVITQPKCNQSNGTIKAIPNNSVGAKTYQWSTISSIDSIISLNSGNFTVTVTDSFCTYSKTVTLNNQKSPDITMSKLNASCGINNGRALITSTLFGTPPFTYNWSNGAVSTNLFNIDSGTYIVTITDANLCMDTGTIYVPRTPMLIANFNITKSTCGQSNAGVITTMSGGVAPYIYSWNSGATSKNLSNIIAGAYVLTISDNGNCTITENVIVDDFKKPKISILQTRPICGKANGELSAIIADGNPAFTYKWNNGMTVPNLYNLSAAIFSLTVTDTKNCVDSIKLTLDPGPTPVADKQITNSTCGYSNGYSALNLPRGQVPIIYSWSTGKIDTIKTNSADYDTLKFLPTGVYYVTISEKRGCLIKDSFTITTTTIPSVSLTPSNSFCSRPTGSISTVVTSGTAPFTYVWSNGTNSSNLNNVVFGNYKVTVSDIHNCTTTGSSTIIETPNLVTATVQPFNLNCFKDNSGKAIFTPSGGTAPYTYIVDGNTISGNTATGLNASWHRYTTTDNLGCGKVDSFLLTEPTQLKQTFIQKSNLKCYRDNTGILEVLGSGGTPPYVYNWTPSGKSGALATGLDSRYHSAICIDNNGCRNTINDSLTQPNNLSIVSSKTLNPCFGQSLATISLVVSQATPPYTFSWNNFANTQNISKLSQGIYTVTITDSNNCKFNKKDTIIDPPRIVINTLDSFDITCKGLHDGQIILNGSGGSGGLLYSIDSGKIFVNQKKFDFLNAGKYFIVVKDINKCQTIATSTINDAPDFKILAYPRDTLVDLDENVQIGYNITIGNPNLVKSNVWSPSSGLSCADCANPIASVYSNREYVVKVDFNTQCHIYDTVRVRVKDVKQLYIPSAFTPGNQSLNSENAIVKVYGDKLLYAHLEIFDRVGAKMFDEMNAHRFGWDGRFKGELCPPNVYTYVLHACYLNQKKVVLQGSITLIR